MKPFRFTLETILELRLEEEQEAEAALGRAMGEWNALNRSAEARLDAKKRFVSAGPGAPEDLFQRGLYMARLDQEIEGLRRQMDERDSQLEKLRKTYRAARAKREGLEKLKEKRRSEHERIRSRLEGHRLDDLLNNMDRLREKHL